MQKTAKDWLKLVQDFEQSGISQVKFCRKHKIPTSSFIYWKQKIAKNNEQIIDAQFIEIPQAQRRFTLLEKANLQSIVALVYRFTMC